MARPPNGRLSLIASQSDSANPVSHTKCTGKHPFAFHHSTCRCAMPQSGGLVHEAAVRPDHQRHRLLASLQERRQDGVEEPVHVGAGAAVVLHAGGQRAGPVGEPAVGNAQHVGVDRDQLVRPEPGSPPRPVLRGRVVGRGGCGHALLLPGDGAVRWCGRTSGQPGVGMGVDGVGEPGQVAAGAGGLAGVDGGARDGGARVEPGVERLDEGPGRLVADRPQAADEGRGPAAQEGLRETAHLRPGRRRLAQAAGVDDDDRSGRREGQRFPFGQRRAQVVEGEGARRAGGRAPPTRLPVRRRAASRGPAGSTASSDRPWPAKCSRSTWPLPSSRARPRRLPGRTARGRNGAR